MNRYSMNLLRKLSITIDYFRLLFFCLFCLSFLTACNSGSSDDTLAATDTGFSIRLPSDMTVKSGNIVELLPEINDTNSLIVTYQWIQTSGSPVPITTDNEPSLVFTAPENDNLAFDIIATDSEGNAYTDTINITVLPADELLNSATLSWNPPLYNTDGSELTNLAGYKIYYGQTETKLDMVILVNDPNLTSYNIDNLSSGTTYFFYITAFNSAGNESEKTDTVTLTL